MYVLTSDILGISKHVEDAYQELDYMYRTVYNIFKQHDEFKNPKGEREVKCTMFSDFMVAQSENLEALLELGCQLWKSCFGKSVWLRGALVQGEMQHHPRIQIDNALTKNMVIGRGLVSANIPEKRGYPGCRMFVLLYDGKDLLTKVQKNVPAEKFENLKGRRNESAEIDIHWGEILWPLYRTHRAQEVEKMISSVKLDQARPSRHRDATLDTLERSLMQFRNIDPKQYKLLREKK